MRGREVIGATASERVSAGHTEKFVLVRAGCHKRAKLSASQSPTSCLGLHPSL